MHTTWAADRAIDGCIDEVDVDAKCTALLLSDENHGIGYWGFLTARQSQGNYSFVQPDNRPIVLAPVPVPNVFSSVLVSGGIDVVTGVESISGGLWLDSGGCDADVVAGYKIYAQTIPTESAEDLSRQHKEGPWRLVDGGESVTGSPHSLGSSVRIHADCSQSSDVILAATLVFDSGFELPHVSGSTRRLRCGL
jgi:hypothetical protein